MSPYACFHAKCRGDTEAGSELPKPAAYSTMVKVLCSAVTEAHSEMEGAVPSDDVAKDPFKQVNMSQSRQY